MELLGYIALFIVIVLAIGLPLSKFQKSVENDKAKATASRRQDSMEAENFVPTDKVEASDWFLGFDGERVAIEQTYSSVIVYVPAGDILSMSVQTDAGVVTSVSRSSQLGGAAVGGLIAGSTGALIGAMGAKSRTTSNVRRVTLSIGVDLDAATPQTLELHFLNPKPKDYVAATEPDQAITRAESVLEKVSRWVASSKPVPAVEPVVAPFGSVADELGKLVELHRDGHLDDEEFKAQKAKLLGS